MRQALVVDDESDARDFVRAILQSEGWEVAEAKDGGSGIEQALALKPELIVLDVQMPDKSGFDVFNELAQNPDAGKSKIIMLTGVADKVGMHFSAEDMGEFYGQAPDAYVEKPINPEAFKRVVNKVCPTP